MIVKMCLSTGAVELLIFGLGQGYYKSNAGITSLSDRFIPYRASRGE